MDVDAGWADCDWQDRARRLSFWLGPVSLGSKALQLREVDVGHDPNAPILDPDIEPLEAWRGGEDGVYLRSQPIPTNLPALERMPRTIRYVIKRYDRHFIDLSGTFEAYLAKFSPKSRQTLQRKARKFHECFGAVDVREYRTAAELETFYAAARAISVRTYQEKLYSAGLPTDEAFQEEMRRMAAADRVRAYLLFADGRPVSYLYCPDEGGGRLSYRHLGYDPGYARHSPGSVLQVAVLERLFAEGRHAVFDFTEGDGEHKRFFSTHRIHCGNVLFLKPRTMLLALVHGHHAVSALERGLYRIAERVGIRARLKHLVRRP